MSRAAVTTLVCLIAAGCTVQTEKGDLTVSWTIGLSEPSEDECSSAGIDSILISLDSSDYDEMDDANCPTGEWTFHGLPVANYRVNVRGLDEAGCAVYEGTLAEAVPSSGEEPATTEIIMQPADPAGSVTLSWRFDDGMMCGAHGIEVVHLQILSNDTMIVDEELHCDAGTASVLYVPAGSIDLRLRAWEGPMELCHISTNLPLEPCDTLAVEASLGPCL